MKNDDGFVAIRVIHAPNLVAAIKLIRAATRLSMADIKAAIANQLPILIAQLYDIDHGEQEQIVITLLDQLDNTGIQFEIIFESEVESRQYFQNAMAQWRDISLQTQIMSDLESGELA